MDALQATALTKESIQINKKIYFESIIDKIKKACEQGFNNVELCISDKEVVKKLRGLLYLVEKKNCNNVYTVSWSKEK